MQGNKTFAAIGMLRGELSRHQLEAIHSLESAHRVRTAITVLQRGKPPVGEQVSKAQPDSNGWAGKNKRTDEQRARMSKAQKKSWKTRRANKLVGRGR